jgi:recombination protein RecA
LKLTLASHLRSEENLKRPEGIETGMAELDRFLFWHGIPKGALTLFNGALGTGATSLWVEAAAKTLAAGKWVVWIDRDVPLSPLPLQNKGMNLGHFVSVEAPEDTDKLFWLLQELMSAQLFDLIGCDLGSLNLKEHQFRKLQAQARESNAALVFLSYRNDSGMALARNERSRTLSQRRRLRGSIASLFSLIVSFEKKRIVIDRALHRQTPQTFTRSVTYARFTHATPDRLGLGEPKDRGSFEGTGPRPLRADDQDDSLTEPRALPEASGSSVVGL